MSPRSYFIAFVILGLGAGACSSQAPRYSIEYYQPAYRQSPPEAVYSRFMWSQLPAPIRPRATNEAPLLLPELVMELPNSTLDEAVEALAQTMGYRWQYPQAVAKRPIRIHMDGTADELLREIGRQAGVDVGFDHTRRVVRVKERHILPALPIQ